MHRDPRVRAVFYQVLILAALAFAGYWIWNNTLANMEARGIRAGFDFLGSEAGFPILYSPFIEYNPAQDNYFRTFLIGLYNTILVSVLGIVLATIIGLVVGLSRLSKNWLVSTLANVYIEIFRNIPLLLQIMFWYFVVLVSNLPPVRESITVGESIFINKKGLYLPKPVWGDGSDLVLMGILAVVVFYFIFRRYAQSYQDRTGIALPVFWSSVALLVVVCIATYYISGQSITLDFPQPGKFRFRGGLVLIPELAALCFALSIYTGAFIAEQIRAGILAVPRGQSEAARSVGLSEGRILRFIILPQALRVIIPPTTSQYLNLTKNSSLAAAIGYPDLVAVFAGTALNQVGRAVEIIGMTMAVYLVLSLSISALMNWYNHHVAIVER